MKKIYITPSMMTVKVSTTKVLAISGTSGVDGLGIGSGTSESGITEGNAHRVTLWGNDE